MSPLLIAGICTVIVGTSFLSGIFGMAGGMVLVGVLLAVLPVPEAMALHAVTQMASNGWRAVLWWRHVRWRVVAAYLAGCAVALAVWSVWLFVRSEEHTSELQSLMRISYAVFCLKKNHITIQHLRTH